MVGKRHTLEYVKKYFEDHGCELLEKEYKNNRTKMRYICSCGNISKINFSDFKLGRRCMECASEKKRQFFQTPYKKVQKFFKDNNCELLEETYKNNRTPLRYRCECGNISKITYHCFKEGRRCQKCSGCEKPTLEYVYNYFKDEGCELLEKEYINNETKMRYRCICGKINKIKFTHFKQGQRCRECGIKKRTGENNHNWNPDLTNEERLIRRHYPEYIKWRNKIYKRDKYYCQKCNIKGYDLNAHHVINYSSNKELRLDEDNGITFCKSCHKQFHKKYGIKNNNRQQLEEFLTV